MIGAWKDAYYPLGCGDDMSEGERMATDAINSQYGEPLSLEADPGWWETAAGDLMRINKMTDRHLANAIAWMKRKVYDGHPKYAELVKEEARRAKARKPWPPPAGSLKRAR